MTAQVRFSPVIRVPNLSGSPGARGALAVLVCVALVVAAHFAIPDPWLAGWVWFHYVIALVLAAVPIYLLMRLVEKLLALGVRARLREWLAEAPRSGAERAAAEFCAGVSASGRSARAGAAVRYLAAVPASDGRALLLGGIEVAPADDGTLSEEADATEGRARKVPPWVYGVLAFTLLVQLVFAVGTGGIKPLYWRSVTWIIVVPAAMNAALILVGWGVIRSPWSIALASPRSLTRGTLQGVLTFTPDDSVLVLQKVNRVVLCVCHRRDGRYASITYPSADTLGLRALVNRWCMLP